MPAPQEGDGGAEYTAAAPQANGADIVIDSADAELDFEEEARDEGGWKTRSNARSNMQSDVSDDALVTVYTCCLLLHCLNKPIPETQPKPKIQPKTRTTPTPAPPRAATTAA